MGSSEVQLTFLDIIDIDEEIIDTRLKSIMERSNYTEKHLRNALLLLQYKHLINKREGTECDNDNECNFIAKLLSDVREENVNIVCDIIKVVISLDVSTLKGKSEHLLQQILPCIDLPHTNDIENDSTAKILLNLKICDSILDAVVEHGEKIMLYFMETPLVNILNYPDEKLKVHFLTHTIPKFYLGVTGYSILDKIWDYMKDLEHDHREKALKILCCLSQYYLPIKDDECNVQTYSEIIYKTEFWRIVLYGLNSVDASVRKTAIYLAKRAIDHAGESKKDISVRDGDVNIFKWSQKYAHILKLEWDNFFILIESLEEKQSNIVIPSLQLFDYLNNFDKCWLMCAFNIGLKHDNALVRLKSIEYRLHFNFENKAEVVSVLEAFNDINLFDNEKETEVLEASILRAIIEKDCVINILKAIPDVKWSPVPLYSLSKVLSMLKETDISLNIKDHDFGTLIMGILKAPCNNIIIRKAIHLNISHFIGNCCKELNWKTLLHIYPLFQNYFDDENPFVKVIRSIILTDEEIVFFLKSMTESQSNVDFCLLYLNSHQENISLFIDMVNELLKNIRNIVDRQYCNKMECIRDVLFIINLFGKTNKHESAVNNVINEVIYRDFKTLCQYILCFFSNDTAGTTSDMELIFAVDHFRIKLNDELGEIFLELYKTSTMFLKEKDIDKRVLSMFIINNIIFNNRQEPFMLKHNKLNIEEVIYWSNDLPTQNVESVGRLKSKFHEESCKLIYNLIKEGDGFKDENLLEFVEKTLDCGGYGCLKWIMKIIDESLSRIISNKQFNIPQFLSRTWSEIEELKSNNQYSVCIQGFVDFLTHEEILKRAEYNNIVLSYCSKIIDYAAVKNTPLCYLITTLNKKESLMPHLICILCEILLYSPVQRKDQRILDSTEIHILNNAKYGLDRQVSNTHYDFQIQYTSLATLSKIKDTETLKIILQIIKTKMDILFRNKVRYHGNSQAHRTFLAALQNLLFVLLLNAKSRSEDLFNWCVEMLGKLPHQPSVRICLEWYITLYLYLGEQTINEHVLQILKARNVPLSSQFTIIYWLLKHKLLRKVCNPQEFDFVMVTLLSHTMGQIFNIRLLAQYLSNNLYVLNKNGSAKYASTIEIIEKTFSQSCNDKNFCKLQNDYFINHFDIVGNFTPYFIYEMVSKYSEVNNNDDRDNHYIKSVLKDINERLHEETEFKEEWRSLRLSDDNFDVKVSGVVEKSQEDVETVGTIQKKYIPWRNMNDVISYEVGKKRESASQLIVVASLIDKLPNLGGMARTCEVFGVKKYIVDSLRHLADKQFQGLSVSAERWVDVEEVRPGRALKEYLTRMKGEGYSIVAAEQTSTSCKLQDFRFPKKTLLLLGHEKEGVPCDLLPMMDHCVEIPQQGFVRSLNVHVTAAIFVWEYARQNIL